MKIKAQQIETFIFALCVWSALLFYGKVVEVSQLEISKINNIFTFFTNYYYSEQSISHFLLFLLIWKMIDIYHIEPETNTLNTKIICAIYATICGLIFVFGKSFMNFNSSILINLNLGQTVTAFMAFIGFGIIFYRIINTMIYHLSQYKNRSFYEEKIFKYNNLKQIVFDKHPVLFSSLLIYLFWIPYIIAYFPGVLHYDGYWQLKMYYGFQDWTTHHPVFSTLLMGKIMDLGKTFGSDNLGVFFYTLPQSFLFAFTLGYGFKFFKSWKTPYLVRILALLFFSIVPIFPMFSYNEVKDSMAYIIYIWIIYIIEEIYERNLLSVNNAVSLFIVSVLSCFARNEMRYILAGFIFILLVFVKKIAFRNYKKLVFIFITAIVVSSICNNIFISSKQIEKGSIGEMLSMPVQQTARYMTQYYNEVSENELTVINSIFGIDDLTSVYDPNKADSVKGLIAADISNKQIVQYMGIWLHQFIKHPLCYFAASFNGTYGYFYPERPEYYGYGFQRSNFVEGDWIYVDDIKISFLEPFQTVREVLGKWMEFFKTSALTSYLFHPGTYGLIFLTLLFLKIIYRQINGGVEITIIPMLTLLVCCLSPLNGGIRYLMSLICCLPFLIAQFLTELQQSEISATKEK